MTNGGTDQDILIGAKRWIENGQGVALATVIATWGSAPRPVGAQMAVNDAGNMIGSVSGGCIEGAVVEAALGTIAGGKHQMLEFGVSDDEAWAVGLACGGRIQILVEKVGL
jgi:xanthine/CO dehydrogenase XdhC/CoxF family maturation factor